MTCIASTEDPVANQILFMYSLMHMNVHIIFGGLTLCSSYTPL